eukprot:CAMPEP_0196149054 /NCGR_PEP_ID=MMETSP0910-20130528/29031_1 /TAXON_ID=49265 /ORGANISM="Thalassiosira rotula, Strain GSO102" /LENGTH=405 /DNA_ID=CAMNT_0041411907 /DNA_START=116 /DNA_END=1333 /DNA_ORIENTATION=-
MTASTTITTTSNYGPIYPPFNPFVRHPTSPLGKVRMILCGSILVPIRLTGAILTLSSCLIWCNICSIGCSDLSKPYSPTRRRLLQGGCRVFSRILLFWYGFVWLHESHEIEDKEEREKQPHPSVVVVNHIGFAELMYLCYSDGCCFVSKDTNRALPFIGKISEVLQSIYVDRGEGEGGRSIHGGQQQGEASSSSSTTMQNSRSHTSDVSSASGGGGSNAKTTTEKILERAHSPPGTWPPLAICPEGTTHTGHVMIRFATGAFRAGLPIQPVIVSSPFSSRFGYDPSFSCANIVMHIICLMTQPMNHLHVKHLAVYVPNDAEKKDPTLYANNVRRKMAQELGVECYDLTWNEKLRFERAEKARELGNQRLAAKNGGVVPPMPIFTEDAFGNPLVEKVESGSKKKND